MWSNLASIQVKRTISSGAPTDEATPSAPLRKETSEERRVKVGRMMVVVDIGVGSKGALGLQRRVIWRRCVKWRRTRESKRRARAEVNSKLERPKPSFRARLLGWSHQVYKEEKVTCSSVDWDLESCLTRFTRVGVGFDTSITTLRRRLSSLSFSREMSIRHEQLMCTAKIGSILLCTTRGKRLRSKRSLEVVIRVVESGLATVELRTGHRVSELSQGMESSEVDVQ